MGADPTLLFFVPNKVSEKQKYGFLPQPANVGIFMRPTGQGAEARGSHGGFRSNASRPGLRLPTIPRRRASSSFWAPVPGR